MLYITKKTEHGPCHQNNGWGHGPSNKMSPPLQPKKAVLLVNIEAKGAVHYQQDEAL